MSKPEKAYTNTATWENLKSSQTTTIKVKEITKNVERNGNDLEYSLEINPAGLDLNPGANSLTL